MRFPMGGKLCVHKKIPHPAGILPPLKLILYEISSFCLQKSYHMYTKNKRLSIHRKWSKKTVDLFLYFLVRLEAANYLANLLIQVEKEEQDSWIER